MASPHHPADMRTAAETAQFGSVLLFDPTNPASAA
jgi:hypothetical protein